MTQVYWGGLKGKPDDVSPCETSLTFETFSCPGQSLRRQVIQCTGGIPGSWAHNEQIIILKPQFIGYADTWLCLLAG